MTAIATNRILPLLLVAALTLSACGPAIFGAGVAVGLRGIAERTTKTLATDTRIRVEVNRALANQAGEQYTRIGVEVFEGRVLLTGTVRADEDKAFVNDLVLGVSNVREVINEITIGNTGDVFDYARDVSIANAIRLRLLEQNRTSEKLDIEMEVVDRVVYLIGIAQDQIAIDEVGQIAATVSGVKAVVSHIILFDDPSRPINES